MTQHGWVKEHRKELDSTVYTNPYYFKLWRTLIMLANHADGKVDFNGQSVTVSSGQLVTGRDALAFIYNRGAQKVHQKSGRLLWKWIKKFEEWQMLTIKSNTKYSVISITNWGKYQQEVQQESIKGPSKVHPESTNKNDKNDKKNTPSPSKLEDDFNKLWGLYPRKEGKKPAFNAYKRAVTRSKNPATNKQIQNGIVAYKQQLSQSGTDKKFIKQGSTFFNQEAWNDYDELAKPERHEQPAFNPDEWLMMAYRTRGTVEGVIEAIEQEGPPISPEYAKTFIETLGR